MSGRQIPLVVPIRSDSILIMGGHDQFAKAQDKNDVYVFNVRSGEMVCEQPAMPLEGVMEGGGFNCTGNQCALLGRSLVVGHVQSRAQPYVVTYIPGHDGIIKKMARLI